MDTVDAEIGGSRDVDENVERLRERNRFGGLECTGGELDVVESGEDGTFQDEGEDEVSEFGVWAVGMCRSSVCMCVELSDIVGERGTARAFFDLAAGLEATSDRVAILRPSL